MFKSLFLVSLLVPSCCYSTPKDNSIPKRELPHVETIEDSTASTSIVGIYNFLPEFEFPTTEVDIEYTFTSSVNNVCLCSYLDQVYFLDSFNISVYDGDIHWVVRWKPSIDSSFVVSDDLYISSGMTLDHVDFNYFKSFFFYLPQSKLLTSQESEYFNYLFTKEDNAYVISYSGYYSFNSSSLGNNYSVLGSITYDSAFYRAYCNTESLQSSIDNQSDFYYYSTVDNNYSIRSYEYPNFMVYLSNCKMSTNSYYQLSHNGIFGYSPDPSAPNDFKDLLFTVMDMPVYFLSRLLNVELFGMNLFVAFAGLLTVAALLLLIRKFF